MSDNTNTNDNANTDNAKTSWKKKSLIGASVAAVTAVATVGGWFIYKALTKTVEVATGEA